MKEKNNPNVAWTYQTLGSLIENIAYIGKREVNKVYKDEDPSHLKPWQKYQIVPAAWPAILDEKIFFDAQNLLEEASLRERTRMSKKEKRIFLLTSILTCGIAGLPMVGQAGHGSSGTIHRYYHYVRRPKDLKVVRPRLNADELEEKVIAELKSALSTQGYFDDLEKTLKSQSDANNKGGAAEFDRAQKELKDVQNRINSIWTNQSRMQLGEEALRLASDELNRLAKQKVDLEKYLSTLDPKANDPYVFKEQTLFVENQIRWCMQGWTKATPAIRKRLLRRTIKEIVVTQTELWITFWTSSDDRDISLNEVTAPDAEGSEKIINIYRRPKSRAAGSENQNLSIISSGNDKVGSESRT